MDNWRPDGLLPPQPPRQTQERKEIVTFKSIGDIGLEIGDAVIPWIILFILFAALSVLMVLLVVGACGIFQEFKDWKHK